MNTSILLFVACVLGATHAGRIPQPDQRIQSMSWQDLSRQKFLLDIVQRVQQPLQLQELIQLDQGLIMDEQRYNGGIDNQMQRIIDLDRQRRLLDRQQEYTIRNVEHVQQLRGIYRLLVRAVDFETLQRNVIYLRRNINPVLLINALTLAIRDRQDTQMLIMPAVQQILPELYLDQETIGRVQSMQLELEQQQKQQTKRPKLIDLVGLGQRLNEVNPVLRMIMPWRDLHLQMALKRQQMQQQTQQNRVVVPVQSQEQEQDISLLTEDIGMRNFVQNLIQELALLEDNTVNQQNVLLGVDQDTNMDILSQRGQVYGDILNRGGQVYGDILNRGGQVYGDILNKREQEGIYNRGGQIYKNILNQRGVEDIQNRRDQVYSDSINQQNIYNERGNAFQDSLNRLQQEQYEDDSIYGNQRERFMGAVRRDGDDNEQLLNSGVRVPLQRGIGQGIFGNRRIASDINQLPTVDINNERLLHVGRRHQNVNRIVPVQEQMQRGFMGVMRGDRLSEGRRVEEVGRRYNVEKKIMQRNQGVYQDEDVLNSSDNFPTVRRDDERLVHINQRRLNQNAALNNLSDEDIMQLSKQEIIELLRLQRQQKEQTQQQRFMGVVRGDRFSEGRRVVEQDQERLQSVPRDDDRLVHINRRRLDQNTDSMIPRRSMDEAILQLTRQGQHVGQLNQEDVIALIHQERQQKEQLQQQQGHRYRRSLVDELQLQDQNQNTRRSEIVLQTLRQLLARINQERIAMRLDQDDLQLYENSRQILPNQNQAQRYALRLNELRLDTRRNRILLDQINSVEQRLQQVIGQLIRVRSGTVSGVNQIEQQVRVERLIGEVLMGRLGEIGLLRILRELMQHSIGVQLDRLGLGVTLGNRVLQYTLGRILNIVDEQREEQLGVYSQQQLDLPQVRINDVRVSKLRTRIEDSDLDVSSLLEQPQQMQLLVRQRRLNNKDFTIDMDISSERAQDVIIRIFLGPGQDRAVSLEQRRKDFVLLDAMQTQLQAGRNRIEKLSTQIGWTTRDTTPYSEIYRRLIMAMHGQQEKVQEIGELIGENGRFPQNLLLPRGRPEGLPMQLLVIVSPVESQQQQQQLVQQVRIAGVMGISRATLEDSRPLGFPLDRRIDNEQQLLGLTNVQIQDVVIVHEN